jgi:hypothetical protein
MSSEAWLFLLLDRFVLTPFAGLEGIVQEVLPHERGIRTLDRYIVAFEWGEQQTFYDVQSAAVPRR